MENKIQIFKNKEFGEIRTIQINDEPWFVGKDVAAALGYQNASKAIIAHIDDEDKKSIMVNITDSQNGNLPIGKTKTTFINESGLYALIFGSKLSEAKKFKRWVTSEVLPTIRRHGAYMTSDTLEKIQANPDIIIQLATALKQEREEHMAELKRERERFQQLQNELQEEKDYSFKTAFDLFMQTEKTFNAKKEIREYKEKAKGYLFIADGLKHLLKENNIRIPGNLLLYREDYDFLNEKDPDMEAFMKRRKKPRK